MNIDQLHFNAPPLKEMIVGIQFSRPNEYTTKNNIEIIDLFKESYSKLEDHPAYQPNFETFGTNYSTNPQFMISEVKPQVRNNYISSDETQLIQLQGDKFFHNWKSNNTVPYAHYENLKNTFLNEILEIDLYHKNTFKKSLSINQCEIYYINHIYYDKENSRPEAWLNLFNVSNVEFSDVNLGFRELILDEFKKPLGRLYFNFTTAFDEKGEKFYNFTIMARGTPADTTITGAIDFLDLCHDKIRDRFKELTTKFAHNRWERKDGTN